jgi:predicted RNase H-like HicB family nuclease
MNYEVIIEEGDTSFGAYVPDLPGCVAVAESRDEVMDLICEAVDMHIESLAKWGCGSGAGNAQPRLGVRIITIMSDKAIITTPYPSPDEIAAYYKIPPKRVAELRQMIDEIRAAEASKASRQKSGKPKASRKSPARRKVTSSKR